MVPTTPDVGFGSVASILLLVLELVLVFLARNHHKRKSILIVVYFGGSSRLYKLFAIRPVLDSAIQSLNVSLAKYK